MFTQKPPFRGSGLGVSCVPCLPVCSLLTPPGWSSPNTLKVIYGDLSLDVCDLWPCLPSQGQIHHFNGIILHVVFQFCSSLIRNLYHHSSPSPWKYSNWSLRSDFKHESWGVTQNGQNFHRCLSMIFSLHSIKYSPSYGMSINLPHL